MGSVVGKIEEEKTASYTVLRELGDDVEIRKYEKMIAVETNIAAIDSGQSFRRLHDYVGANGVAAM